MILGELAATEGDWTLRATANQLIIYQDDVENMRLTIDSETHQYTTTEGVSRTIELHSYDELNSSYTGVDWGGAAITLTSTDQTDSGDDGAEQQAESDSQGLINVGIIATLIVIVLSLMAIQSMRN